MARAAILWWQRGKKGLVVRPGHATDLQLERLTDLERHVLQRVLGRTPIAHDPNQHFDAQMTFGQRLADRVAMFGGSWTFIGGFGAILLVWMTINVEQFQRIERRLSGLDGERRT